MFQSSARFSADSLGGAVFSVLSTSARLSRCIAHIDLAKPGRVANGHGNDGDDHSLVFKYILFQRCESIKVP